MPLFMKSRPGLHLIEKFYCVFPEIALEIYRVGVYNMRGKEIIPLNSQKGGEGFGEKPYR